MKTIIIGCSELPNDAVARKIIEMGLEEKVEIVIVKENKPPEIKELSKEIKKYKIFLHKNYISAISHPLAHLIDTCSAISVEPII